MPEVFAFIPGFLPALERSPAALEARARLSKTIEAGFLTSRDRAFIGLSVAHVSRCDYCLWAQTNVARQAGLTGEDLLLCSAGTALDRREAAIVRLSAEIARSGSFAEHEVKQLRHDPILGTSEVMEIVANAAYAVINNYLIQSVDPADTTTARQKRAA